MTLNCPFPAGSGRKEILGAFQEKLLPAAEKFRPELVLISAGFDSRVGDPLGGFTLTDPDFADLTARDARDRGSTCRRPPAFGAGRRIQLDGIGRRCSRTCGGSASDFASRRPTERDVPIILDFIRQLAEYEKLSHLVVATEAHIREQVFGANPVAEVLLAFLGRRTGWIRTVPSQLLDVSGPSGNLSGRSFVEPEHRGKGIGKALLIRLAKIAVERGYGRLEWAVLDWNAPSIEFYRSLGAVPLDEWTAYRLTGDALSRLALSDRRGA